ncbi:MAG: hypothetical protein KF819_08960 [Labilithrix sp.]|nr:hypothetical protein [Labilithrix sp.]
MDPKPRNNRQDPVTKFCLAMEELRRTETARVRDAKELVDTFFPHDAAKATDRLFLHIPREVRAPIVAGWGIRGAKAALRDDDERIRTVVHDAILAGDIDVDAIEQGVTAAVLIDWVPLSDWWAFWRAGKVNGAPVQKALATARELGLFDDKWFLENLEGRGGRLKGTDTICDTLSKDQIVSWVRSIHASGNGTPAGIVAALGWDTVLAKTAQEALLFATDALAKKVGLVPTQPVEPAPAEPAVRGSEVPGIAIPDFPMEEKGAEGEQIVAGPNDGSLQPVADSAWPELAGPGDMGYAMVQPTAMGLPNVKPSYGLDDDEEVTSEHHIVAKPPAPPPPKR